MGWKRAGTAATQRGTHRVALIGVALLAVLALDNVLPVGAFPPTTWGSPTPLTGATFYPQMPKVTIDAAGTATAVWAGGDEYYDRTILTSTQRAGGSWTAPVTLADGGSEAVLAANSAGAAVAAWEGDDGVIRASSRAAGGDWAAATTISVGADAVAKASKVRVAVNESGDVITVWQQRDFPFERVWLARSSAGGAWEAPMPIALNVGDADMRPDVAVDASGDAVLAWMEGIPGATKVLARTSMGPVWGPVIGLDAEAGVSAGSPSVAMDDAGDAVVVWGNSSTGLRSAMRPAGGGWSPANEVAANGSAPAAIVIDPHGDTTVAWSTYTNTGLVVFAAHRTLTAPWSEPVALSGPSATTMGSGPELSGNRVGDVTAVWEVRGGDPQRSSVLVSSRAAGGDWSPPSTLSLPEQDSSSAEVAIGADGDAVVAYLDRTFDALSPTSTVWTVRSPAPPVPPSEPSIAPPVKLLPRFTG